MGYNSKRLHILLVDDHHDTVRALDRLLRMEGHCVTPAESCDEAIAAARALRFDVLLSDIGMPEKDGFALLKELRAPLPSPRCSDHWLWQTPRGTPHDGGRLRCPRS
jgi:CheY-like chemotaxis protein